MPSRLERTERLLAEGRAAGDHLGGQLYVSLEGATVADLAFGEVRPGEPMRRDHLMLWLSAGKPVTAVAVARLWERGALAPDDRVVRHLAEFGGGGKQKVTIRHLLTHTAGIRSLDVGWPKRSWDEILEHICEMKLEPRWVPGRKAGYHLSSSWFVLAEIVRRISGEEIGPHLRAEIFEPLGMDDCWLGMPSATYGELEPHLAPVFDTEASPAEPHDWTGERRITRASPGANVVGPMRQLGRLYEMLDGGGELDGRRLLRPQTVEAMTVRQRVGLFDHTFRQKLDWGLGFVLDSRHYGEELPAYGYGARASRRVFGHSGYRTTVGLADPEHRLVVALGVNGTPSAARHARRFHGLLGAIYEDLDLGDDGGAAQG